MSQCFNKIFLSWRLGKTFSRIMVGTIDSTPSGAVFSYIREGVEEAKKFGFNGYPGFSLDQMEYKQNVLDFFSKRLINMERTDTKELLDFWEINPIYKSDILYMLAMTQGKMQTDSFEFLASFMPANGVCFVTDIAGLNFRNFDLGQIKEGSILSFEREPNNIKDNKAVKVLFKGEVLGYIKRGHNEFFYGEISDRIKLCVKSVTNTPSYKELYVKVYT